MIKLQTSGSELELYEFNELDKDVQENITNSYKNYKENLYFEDGSQTKYTLEDIKEFDGGEREVWGRWNGNSYIERTPQFEQLTEEEFGYAFLGGHVSYDEFRYKMDHEDETDYSFTVTELLGEFASDYHLEYGHSVLEGLNVHYQICDLEINEDGNTIDLDTEFQFEGNLDNQTVEWNDISDSSKEHIMSKMAQGVSGGDLVEVEYIEINLSFEDRVKAAKEKVAQDKSEAKQKPIKDIER